MIWRCRTKRGRSVKAQAPLVSFYRARALGVVGPYLAVDLRDEGLAVLVVLLELANLLKLLGGKTLDPLDDLVHGQRVVIGGPERRQDGRPDLRLAGGLLRLAQDLFGLPSGLLGQPQALPGYLLSGLKTLPCYLLGSLQPLLGGPLEGPHA